jgi:hypothetical protein
VNLSLSCYDVCFHIILAESAPSRGIISGENILRISLLFCMRNGNWRALSRGAKWRSAISSEVFQLAPRRAHSKSLQLKCIHCEAVKCMQSRKLGCVRRLPTLEVELPTYRFRLFQSGEAIVRPGKKSSAGNFHLTIREKRIQRVARMFVRLTAKSSGSECIALGIIASLRCIKASCS